MSDRLAQSLDGEARRLLRFAWDALAESSPSERTREFLSDRGVGEAEEQQLWPIRLALPPLSAREIGGLLRYRDMLNDATDAERDVAPDRFSILLLAGRLGMDAVSAHPPPRWGRFARPLNLLKDSPLSAVLHSVAPITDEGSDPSVGKLI
jgi:hypothetical protein